jgi:hypothetical protein
MIDVTLNAGGRDAGAGPGLVSVKLQSPSWEFNFCATPSELDGLRAIRGADWVMRHSLHIGVSAGAPVHWSANGETVTVMVGHDDETWDIALEIPLSTVDDIVANMAAANW